MPLFSSLLSFWFCVLPQFQDASRVQGWVDPADKVEVPDIEAAIYAHRQGNWC